MASINAWLGRLPHPAAAKSRIRCCCCGSDMIRPCGEEAGAPAGARCADCGEQLGRWGDLVASDHGAVGPAIPAYAASWRDRDPLRVLT